jgi:hypothetical protein
MRGLAVRELRSTRDATVAADRMSLEVAQGDPASRKPMREE